MNKEITKHIDHIIDRVGKSKNTWRITQDMNDIRQWANSTKDIDPGSDPDDYSEELNDIWAMESDMTSPGWVINYLEKHVQPEDASEVLKRAAEGIETKYLDIKDTDITLDPITWLKDKSYSNATPISDIMSEYAEYCIKELKV
jgi:hypothetical protein